MYALFRCRSCYREWPDKLPPMEEELPRCCCASRSEVVTLLVDVGAILGFDWRLGRIASGGGKD